MKILFVAIMDADITTRIRDYSKISLALFSIAYICIVLVLGLDSSLRPYNYLIMLFANIYMLLCSKKNFFLFIITFFLFFFNYSIVFANFWGYIDNMFTEQISAAITETSINILSLFNCFLLFFVRWEKIEESSGDNLYLKEENKNTIIIYILSISLIFVFLFGFTRPALGERGSPTPIYEYSVILFALYFYYSGGNKRYLLYGQFLVFLFATQSFIYAGRVDAIQFILCTYIMIYMYKTRMRNVILAMIVAFFFLSIIGAVRGELLSGNFDIGSIFISLFKGGFALDTAYSAYYTSETFVYVRDQLDVGQILDLFFSFVKGIFLGGAAGESANLPMVTKQYIMHYEGGILPFHLYFYMGIWGVIISSLIVSAYINLLIRVDKLKSDYLHFVSIWIVCSVFRWYLYSSSPLLRGVMILSVLFFAFNSLDRVVKSIKTISFK